MDPRVRRAHYYLGTSAILEEGIIRLDEAIAEFRKELQIAPDDALATLRLGVVLVEARRYEEAMPLLERAVREPTAPYDAWLFLGRCQLAMGRAADAVASLKRALDAARRTGSTPAADARRRYVRYQLATALRATGAHAEAEREFAEAQRLSAEQLESARDQLARYMADTMDTAAATAPVPSAGDRPGSTRSLTPNAPRFRGDWAPPWRGPTSISGSSTHRRLVSRAPRSCSSWPQGSIRPFRRSRYSLGVAYFSAEQYEKAVPALTRATEQQPQDADSRRMLALASLNAGDYTRAADLLRADPKLPADPSLQYAFGLALVRSDRAEEAEKIFSRVLLEHPDVPELNVVVGQIHAARGDFDAAVASLRRAVELKPDVPEANASLGDIYMRQGDFRAATKALRAELAARPGNVKARNTLATVLDLDGKSDEAIRELRAIVAVKPNYADARYLFGKILLARGAEAEAIGHLEVAARVSRPRMPTSPISSGRPTSGSDGRNSRHRRLKRING